GDLVLRHLLDRGAGPGARFDLQLQPLVLVEALLQAVVERRVLAIGHPVEHQRDLLGAGAAALARRAGTLGGAAGHHEHPGEDERDQSSSHGISLRHKLVMGAWARRLACHGTRSASATSIRTNSTMPMIDIRISEAKS